MNSHPIAHRWRLTGASLVVACATACTSTPRHSNTMIFGTNTRVALDVSQDAAGSLGVTLGYKRQEAVWMPLLPNQAASAPAGETTPAPCTDGKCQRFEGIGAAGRDTYSVLATFGSTLDASAEKTNGAKAGGTIAQFFATGLAARALAEGGGAALVNTRGDIALTADERAAAAARAERTVADTETLLGQLAAVDDKTQINTEKLKKVLATPPASTSISEATKEDLLASLSIADLRGALSVRRRALALQPMLDSLKALAPQ